MTASGPLDDERGVDRAAIRELLRLSPAERVQRLVETVAVWQEILEHCRRSGEVAWPSTLD